MTVTRRWTAACLVLTLGAAPATAQVRFSGLVDLVQTVGDSPGPSNEFLRGDNPFHHIRAKFFTDTRLSDHLAVFTQVWVDDQADASRGGQIRLEGAYLALTELGLGHLGFKAGKIPSPFGTFAERTYSDRNPVIGVPLMYGYRTTASSRYSPPIGPMPQLQGPNGGLTILYDACWDTGVELFNTHRWLEYGVALTNGVVTNPRFAADNDGFGVVGRIGLIPDISTRLGFSFAHGPYLPPLSAAILSAGSATEDFNQTVLGGDLTFARGHFQLIGELARNEFETPIAPQPTLRNTVWYVESQYTLAPGWYAAVRYDQMMFDRIADGAGGRRRWDDNVIRVEGGLGFQYSRDVLVKAIYQATRFPDNKARNEDIAAVQISLNIY